MCSAAAGACYQLTASSEGYVPKAKRDPAGILTGCNGERVDLSDLDPNRIYSRSECAERLRKRLAQQYAPPITACLPEIVDEKRVKLFGALIDASYNAGPAGVCKSPMAAYVRSGFVNLACDAFSANYQVEGMTIHGWFASARYAGKPQPAAAMRAHGWTWTGRHWRKELPGLVTRRKEEAKLCRS